MPTQPIPFGVQQQSGLSELGGGSPSMMNVVVDDLGVMRRRPGIQAYSAAPSTVIDADGITGLYVPASGDLFAVGGHASSKKVYRVLPGGAAHLGSITATGRPVFADTESILAIAGGSVPCKIVYDTLAFSTLGGGPPSYVSHIVANNNRLLANDLDAYKNQVFWSEQAAGSSYSGYESWASGTAGYFSADARPDPIVAIGENSNEVFVWGLTCVQVFVNDTDLVYASTITREYGCMAPYSIVKLEEGFGWLDHKKRIVIGAGRDVKVISGDIQKQLDTMDIAGCYAYLADVGPYSSICWAFPASGTTFAFSDKAGWSQWSGWDSATGNWKACPITASFTRPDDGTVVVGTSEGYIGELSVDATSDLGEEIHASATTGFLDRGTSKLKNTTALRLTLRRGSTTSSTAPVALVSWRDDFGSFSAPMPIDLGATGDSHVVVEYKSLGVYRSRQWKVQFIGTDEFELVSAEEDFTVQGV